MAAMTDQLSIIASTNGHRPAAARVPRRRRRRTQPTAALVNVTRWIALGITVGIGIASFVLSFATLVDLAHRAGYPAALAWLWPLAIDGTIVQATVAIVALAGYPTQSRHRKFFWSVLAVARRNISLRERPTRVAAARSAAGRLRRHRVHTAVVVVGDDTRPRGVGEVPAAAGQAGAMNAGKNSDLWRDVNSTAAARPRSWCRGCGYFPTVNNGTHRTDCTERNPTMTTSPTPIRRWKWVVGDDGEKYFNVGLNDDGSIYNPNGYPYALVRAAVEAAEARRHARASAAAQKAAQTRRRRTDELVYRTVERLRAAGSSPPGIHCESAGAA
jgi:hypothetical protein